MNRSTRRALDRATKNRPDRLKTGNPTVIGRIVAPNAQLARPETRVRKSGASEAPLREKFPHRLASQACVLFVPMLRSYVTEFSGSDLRFTELPELARIYADDEVTSVASRFRELTGCRVEVRPFLCQRSTEMRELLHAFRIAP